MRKESDGDMKSVQQILDEIDRIYQRNQHRLAELPGPMIINPHSNIEWAANFGQMHVLSQLKEFILEEPECEHEWKYLNMIDVYQCSKCGRQDPWGDIDPEKIQVFK